MPIDGLRLRRRRDRPSRRLDITPYRELLADGRVWTALGLSEGTFEILTDENGKAFDVLVDVRIQPRNESVLCRLGNDGGLWRIPRAGIELAVLVPLGAWEDADPLIVARLSTNAVPDGLGDAAVVLAVDPGQVFLVHDGDASEAVALARADHVHDLPKLTSPSGDVTLGGATPNPGTTGTPDKVTTVLKAK